MSSFVPSTQFQTNYRSKTIFLYASLFEEKGVPKTYFFPFDLGDAKWGNLDFTPSYMIVRQAGYLSKDKNPTDEMNIITADFVKDSPLGIISPYFAPDSIINMDLHFECNFKSTFHNVKIGIYRITDGEIELAHYDRGHVTVTIEFFNYNPRLYHA